jgi:trigger factor
MNPIFEKQSSNQGQLTITLTPEAYRTEFKKELEKVKNKGNFKGFRVGKAPESYVKKIYGKAIAQDVVLKKVQDIANEWVESTEEKLLGYPIYSEDSPSLDFSALDKGTYTFKMDIGFLPEFELKGLDSSTIVKNYKIKPNEISARETLEKVRLEQKRSVPFEGPITEDDAIILEIVETENGVIKETPLKNEFKIIVNTIKDEAVRNDIIGKEKGYVFNLDIFCLESEDEDFVKKYYLGLEESDDIQEVSRFYQATIIETERVGPPPMDEEFLLSLFPEEELKTEEEVIQKIMDIQSEGLTSSARSLMYMDLMDILDEMNPIDLPAGIIKRLVEMSSENPISLSEEQLQQQLKNERRGIIQEEIIKRGEISVTKEELEESFRKRINQMFGGYNLEEDMMQSFVERMMSDKKSLKETHTELLTAKIFEYGLTQVTLEDTYITDEEASALFKARDQKEALEKSLFDSEEE